MKRNVLVLGCKNYPAFSSNKVISGGMEVYVWELVKHLKEDFDFIIIAGYSKSDNASVKVISVPIFGGFAWQPISLLFFSFVVCLGLIIRRMKIDLINAQTPLSGLIGFIFKKLFGVPYVVSVHIFASTKEHVGRFAGIYGAIEKIVLNNSDKVICAGYKLQEHLITKYNLPSSHFVIIHPGMDQVSADKVTVGATLNKVLEDPSFKLLFLGRLVEEMSLPSLHRDPCSRQGFCTESCRSRRGMAQGQKGRVFRPTRGVRWLHRLGSASFDPDSLPRHPRRIHHRSGRKRRHRWHEAHR